MTPVPGAPLCSQCLIVMTLSNSFALVLVMYVMFFSCRWWEWEICRPTSLTTCRWSRQIYATRRWYGKSATLSTTSTRSQRISSRASGIVSPTTMQVYAPSTTALLWRRWRSRKWKGATKLWRSSQLPSIRRRTNLHTTSACSQTNTWHHLVSRIVTTSCAVNTNSWTKWQWRRSWHSTVFRSTCGGMRGAEGRDWEGFPPTCRQSAPCCSSTHRRTCKFSIAHFDRFSCTLHSSCLCMWRYLCRVVYCFNWSLCCTLSSLV